VSAGVPARARSPVATGLIGKGAELLSQVLLLVAVPSVLGPRSYGEFALAFSVVSVTSASMAIGGPAVMTRFVPAAPPERRDALARALVARLGRWRAAQMAAIACTGLILALAAPGTFSPLFTVLVVTAIACDAAATLVFQAALGFGRAALWSFRSSMQNLVLVVAAIVGFEAFGVEGAVAGLAVASVAVLAVASRVVVPRLRHAPGDGEVPAGALRFGTFQALSGVLLQLQERGGVVAVALLNGSRVEAGFASIAIGVALAPVWAVRQAFHVQLPELVAAMGEDVEAAEAIVRRSAHRIQLALLPLALAGAVWGDDLLTLVLGQRFRGAGTALAVALAVLPLAAPVTLGVQVSALRLRPEARLKALAAGTVAFLAAAVLTIPGSGATGAAIALLAGSAAALAGLMATLPRLLGPRRAAFTAATVALVAAAGALT
jgi:O-antigen/teichoic acid export membrane protein